MIHLKQSGATWVALLEPPAGRRLSPTALPAAGRAPTVKALDPMGKHSLGRNRPTSRQHTLVDMVDNRSLLIHRMTPGAAAEGLRPQGRYIALCGEEVIPASLTEPGRHPCQPCGMAAVSTIPNQRSRAAR